VVVHGKALVLVHVKFDNPNAIPELFFQLLKYGVHHLTRATPSGVEVNQRQLIAVDNVIEFLHFYSTPLGFLYVILWLLLQIYGKKSETQMIFMNFK